MAEGRQMSCSMFHTAGFNKPFVFIFLITVYDFCRSFQINLFTLGCFVNRTPHACLNLYNCLLHLAFLNTILRISWGQMIHQSRVYRKSTISNGKWEARPGAL